MQRLKKFTKQTRVKNGRIALKKRVRNNMKTDLRNAAVISRGVRNNNPFNIRKGSSKWVGKVKGLDTSFETFDTLENGIRAGVINTLTHYKRGADTIKKLIEVHAPPNENNTKLYIKNVSNWVGINENEKIILTPSFFYKYVAAIIAFENDAKDRPFIKPASIVEGVNLALNGKKIQPKENDPLPLESIRLTGLFLLLFILIVINF